MGRSNEVMKIEKNQTTRTDTRIARLVLVAETEEDHDLLEDMLTYLEFLKEEKEREKEF